MTLRRGGVGKNCLYRKMTQLNLTQTFWNIVPIIRKFLQRFSKIFNNLDSEWLLHKSPKFYQVLKYSAIFSKVLVKVTKSIFLRKVGALKNQSEKGPTAIGQSEMSRNERGQSGKGQSEIGQSEKVPSLNEFSPKGEGPKWQRLNGKG